MTAVETIANQSIGLRKEKRYKEAEQLLRTALDDEGSAWQLWNQLGHVLVAIDDYDEAAIAFENATRLNPNGFWLWLSLGYVRKEMRQIDGAIDATLMATKLGTKPNELGSALYNLGCFNCIAGRHEEALGYLKRAFKTDSAMKEWAREDSDLESLQADVRFQDMIKSD